MWFFFLEKHYMEYLVYRKIGYSDESLETSGLGFNLTRSQQNVCYWWVNPLPIWAISFALFRWRDALQQYYSFPHQAQHPCRRQCRGYSHCCTLLAILGGWWARVAGYSRRLRYEGGRSITGQPILTSQIMKFSLDVYRRQDVFTSRRSYTWGILKSTTGVFLNYLGGELYKL